MRIILSPTKKMKIDDSLDYPLSRPVYLEKTKRLLDYLKTLSYDELKKLLNCNDQITTLNFSRFEEMDLEKMLSCALLSYDGIAFQYMAPQVFTKDYFDYVKEHLRILSGFYGVLKPFDGVCCYRLEMQTKLNAPFASNLYDFWKDDLYNEVIDDSHIILNLASNEYSKCIKKYLKKEDLFVDVIFGEFKGNKVIEKGVYVKMARGEMVRYMAEHHIENLQDIKKFNRLGFRFDETLSTNTKYVFIKENERNEKSIKF